MIIQANMAEVKVSAPRFPQCKPMQCWRLNRGDMELRKHYQTMMQNEGIRILLIDILVEGDYKKAA